LGRYVDEAEGEGEGYMEGEGEYGKHLFELSLCGLNISDVGL
jgi:hypothetical protein